MRQLLVTNLKLHLSSLLYARWGICTTVQSLSQQEGPWVRFMVTAWLHNVNLRASPLHTWEVSHQYPSPFPSADPVKKTAYKSIHSKHVSHSAMSLFWCYISVSRSLGSTCVDQKPFTDPYHIMIWGARSDNSGFKCNCGIKIKLAFSQKWEKVDWIRATPVSFGTGFGMAAKIRQWIPLPTYAGSAVRSLGAIAMTIWKSMYRDF